MPTRLCDACRDVRKCPVCHQPVAGFRHVGVRGVALPSGIWHYAVPCGHRYDPTKQVQASMGALAAYKGGPLWQPGYRWQNVYWGFYWNQANLPFTPVQVDKATADLEADRAYSGGLSEYSVGQGSLSTSVVIGSDPPPTVDDLQIGGFISQWVKAGLVPELGQKGAYNIFFPPGVTVTLSGDRSCATFCDFHDTDGTHFYTVEPYPCQTGCNQCTNDEFDTLTQGLSEEMVELKTDMDPGTGWVIGNEELCDHCDAHFKCNQISTREYVNAWYSNREGACLVLSAPSQSFAVTAGLVMRRRVRAGKDTTGSSLQAQQLSLLVNAYAIAAGPPKKIVVPNASQLARLQEVTVDGTLLNKQYVTLNPRANVRSTRMAPNGGAYFVEPGDGDIHFCLGDKPLQPGISCELQGGTPWLSLFNSSRGQAATVAGFFRCLFEHPGFDPLDDAHIFEIHPVRAVVLGGKPQAFDVAIPDQKSIHTWDSPYPLSQQDSQVTVGYDAGKDVFTFEGMQGKDENYVSVSGTVSNINLNANSQAPASFTLDSPQVGHPLTVYCLQGTNAARQLRGLTSQSISMVGLRDIDLAQAMKGSYVINLLGIDIQ